MAIETPEIEIEIAEHFRLENIFPGNHLSLEVRKSDLGCLSIYFENTITDREKYYDCDHPEDLADNINEAIGPMPKHFALRLRDYLNAIYPKNEDSL